jgi:hypothetical protein
MPPTRRRSAICLLALLGVVAALVVPASPVAAATVTANGFTTSTRAFPSQATRGSTVKLVVSVTAAAARTALTDVEVYDTSGRKVFQRAWDDQSFAAGTARSFTANWPVPSDLPIGTYRVDVGIFGVGWSSLYHWNSGATTVRVVAAAPPATTTTLPATTTTQPATTTTRPATTTTTQPATTTTIPATTTTTTTTTLPVTTTTVPSGRFETLEPGSPLPDDPRPRSAM